MACDPEWGFELRLVAGVEFWRTPVDAPEADRDIAVAGSFARTDRGPRRA